MTHSPADALRDHLNARTRRTLIRAGKNIGKLTVAEQKSPSRRKSEAMRKKLAKRAGVTLKTPAPGGVDCWTCPLQPCGKTPDTCPEKTMIHPCLKCGQRVRHYVAVGNPWLHCPKCREEA